jgi:hypothetical protein
VKYPIALALIAAIITPRIAALISSGSLSSNARMRLFKRSLLLIGSKCNHLDVTPRGRVAREAPLDKDSAGLVYAVKLPRSMSAASEGSVAELLRQPAFGVCEHRPSPPQLLDFDQNIVLESAESRYDPPAWTVLNGCCLASSLCWLSSEYWHFSWSGFLSNRNPTHTGDAIPHLCLDAACNFGLHCVTADRDESGHQRWEVKHSP